MKKIIIALACMLLGITSMQAQEFTLEYNCLLYTSDAADE